MLFIVDRTTGPWIWLDLQKRLTVGIRSPIVIYVVILL